MNTILRAARAAFLTGAALAALTGCGSDTPKVTSAAQAEAIINDVFSTGYSMWTPSLDPIGPTSTCEDANGQWIAGCQAWLLGNARPINGPESGWSWWQLDSLRIYDDGRRIEEAVCFGVIPAHDGYDADAYATACNTVGGPTTS